MKKMILVFLLVLGAASPAFSTPCVAPFECISVPDVCTWDYKTFSNTATKTAKQQYTEWKTANDYKDYFDSEIVYASSTLSTIIVHYRVSCTCKTVCHNGFDGGECER